MGEPCRMAFVDSSMFGIPFKGYDYYQNRIGSQPLTKNPQQVWQTLKNFDYPAVNGIISRHCGFFFFI